MADPIRQALESLLAAEAHIHVAGPEYVQARDAAYAALAAKPPAPAPAADGERDHVPGAGTIFPAAYAARLRQCPTHGQLPANAWGCPECLRELREELARLRAPAADGKREELLERLRLLASWMDDNNMTDDYILITSAADLLRASAPVVDQEREELARWFEREAECASRHGMTNIDNDEDLRRAAALLRQPGHAPVPVAVAERPWERPGWCDAEGRCWWGRCADDFFSPEWTMATLANIEEFCSDAMPQHCLPHWAIPQPPQGGEVEQ